MQRQAVVQHLLDRRAHRRMVVPQRQGAGAGQAVQEHAAFHVFDIHARRAPQRQRNAAGVAARIGLLFALALEQRVGRQAVGLAQGVVAPGQFVGGFKRGQGRNR
ncbi:hypothetical protein D3C71_1528340 [compost metagenome]